MLIGSLVIGLVADATQARGIEPFTTDIFKGLDILDTKYKYIQD